MSLNIATSGKAAVATTEVSCKVSTTAIKHATVRIRVVPLPNEWTPTARYSDINQIVEIINDIHILMPSITNINPRLIRGDIDVKPGHISRDDSIPIMIGITPINTEVVTTIHIMANLGKYALVLQVEQLHFEHSHAV